ncbi:MAG: hypothetical protein R3C11_18300 [Planctomycetaceae bacterium]
MPRPSLTPSASTGEAVRIRGLRVHNLKALDLEIPLNQLVVVVGVSGSGKSSLAHHTLYVEGQRRFNETLSPQLRQMLGTFPKPGADEISQLPPTITLRELSPREQNQATVGALTEINESLAVLFTRLGNMVCPECQSPIEPATPESVLKRIESWPEKCRYQIAFASSEPEDVWREAGFIRTIPLQQIYPDHEGSLVIVDRLTVGGSDQQRILESLETGFTQGEGELLLLREPDPQDDGLIEIDGRTWKLLSFSSLHSCPTCHMKLQPPHPQLFNPHSSYGKCDTCKGAGQLWSFDLRKLIPDESLTLKQGAVALTLEKGLERLRLRIEKLAQKSKIPVELPIHAWESDERQNFREVLVSFLTDELQSKARFQSERFREKWMQQAPCSTCAGTGYALTANAVRLLGLSYRDWQQLSISEVHDKLAQFDEELVSNFELVLAELKNRLQSLLELGLEELTLNRKCATLSSGERKLVQVASLLAVGLVNTLYILDEPSRGLHPEDQTLLLAQFQKLLEQGNSLLVVEHSDLFWKAADQLLELGPGPGTEGGELLYQGSFANILEANTPTSRTHCCASRAETISRRWSDQTTRRRDELSPALRPRNSCQCPHSCFWNQWEW